MQRRRPLQPGNLKAGFLWQQGDQVRGGEHAGAVVKTVRNDADRILMSECKEAQHGADTAHFTDAGLYDVDSARGHQLDELPIACGIFPGGNRDPGTANPCKTGDIFRRPDGLLQPV